MNKRAGTFRPTILRMTKIWAMIRDGELPTAISLAEQFETSTKTIHRDLEFMRDQIMLPIRFNKKHNGWVVEPGVKLPWWLMEGEKK